MFIFMRSFAVACVFCFLSSSYLFSMNLLSDEKLDNIENSLLENRQPSPKKKKLEKSSLLSGSFTVYTHCAISSFSKVDPKTLFIPQRTTIVFFDIDRTAVCPKYELFNFMENEQVAILNEFYKKRYFDGNYEEFKEFLNYLKITQNMSYENYISKYYIKDEKLVENSLLSFIDTLQKNETIVMGLTARSFIIANDTDSSLKSLGIDFKKLSRGIEIASASFLNKTNLNSRGGFQNGIFYTGNQVHKVSIIPQIVSLISEKLNVAGPFTVHHFDDSEDEIKAFYNTKSLESNHHISVYPHYYTGHEEHINSLRANLNRVHQEIDEELVEKFFHSKEEEKSKK